MGEKFSQKILEIPSNVLSWWKQESKLTPYHSYPKSERVHRLRTALYLAVLTFAGSRLADSENATISLQALRNATVQNAFFESQCHQNSECNFHETLLWLEEYTNPSFWSEWLKGDNSEQMSQILETESIQSVYAKDSALFDTLAKHLPHKLNHFDTAGGLSYLVAQRFAYDTAQSEALEGNGAYLESFERILIDGSAICTGSMMTTFGILKSAGYPVIAIQFTPPKSEEMPSPIGHAVIGLEFTKSELKLELKTSQAVTWKGKVRNSFLSQYSAFQMPGSQKVIVVFDTTANAVQLKSHQSLETMGKQIQSMQVTPFTHNNDLGAVNDMQNPGTSITLVHTDFSAEYITASNSITTFTLDSLLANH